MPTKNRKDAEEDMVTPISSASPRNGIPNKQKPAGAASGFCVYLGPTIMGVIQTGAIYHGTKPDVLKSIESAASQYPRISTLIVDGETLAVDRMKVKTPGNLLYVNYRKLTDEKNN